MWEREDYSKANIESKLKFADGIYFNLRIWKQCICL